MTHQFEFTEKTIINHNEIFIEFEYVVKDLIVLDNSIVILFDFDSIKVERNVFCYGLNKSLKWQIPEPIKIHSRNYFTSIYLKDNKVCAYSISGIEYHLNKETGLVLDSELIK